MAFPTMDEISWKFAGKPYDLNSIIGPDQVWENLDLGPEEVRTALNLIIEKLNTEGAANLNMAIIPSISASANTAQTIMEALASRLTAITDGLSGADFIGVTAIAGVAGTKLQPFLEAFKIYVDAQDSNLQGQIDSNDGDILALESRATTSESDIDALQIADGQNVKVSGSQTIEGVKTFSSSPIVPTPTGDTDAANKAFVMGQSPLTIGNGSLGDLKLSDAPGDIKQRFESYKAESATYKKAQGLVGDYNKVTKTGTNNTPILQGVIDELEAVIRADGFGTIDNVIAIPTGYYYFSTPLTMSPIVKLKAMGHVVFVYGGSGTFVTIECGVEPNFFQEMWNMGSLIDGSNGGIMMFCVTEPNTGTVAIQLGNSVDGNTNCSRYSLNAIGIAKFDIGLKFKGYDHYLGDFYRLYIDYCNRSIDVEDLVTNSGENFTFWKCVFAHANDVLYTFSSFSFTFVGCSFDFNQRIVSFDSLSTGFTTVKFIGCYYEMVYDALVYNYCTGTQLPPNIYFTDCTIYTNRKQLFKTALKGYNVHLKGVEFWYIFTEQTRLPLDIFAVDYTKASVIKIYYRDIAYTRKQAWQLLEPSILPCLNFSNGVVGNSIVAGTMPGITYVSKGAITSDAIVDTEYYTGVTSLHVVASSDSSWYEFTTADKLYVSYGDKVVLSNIHKVVDAGVNGVIGIQYNFKLYDDADVLLETIAMHAEDTMPALDTWYTSYRFTIGGLNGAEVVISNPKCRYVKVNATYSGFVDLYIDQVAINVLK